MRTKTRQLLDAKVGRMTQADWAVPGRVLFWWIPQHSQESVEMSWKLMDRFVKEQERQEIHRVSATYWLRQVVDSWRLQSIRDGCTVMTPQQVLQKIDNYMPTVLPNARIYSMLVDAFTKTDARNAPQFAEMVLRRLKRECKQNPKVTPDSVIYTNVIHAWARSGLPEAPYRAKLLLNDMIAFIRGVPAVEAVFEVLNALANSNVPGAAEEAEALLNSIEARYGQLDGHCYGAVITAFAKAGKGEHSESILRRLQDLFHETRDERIKPNIVHFNSVIHGYCRQGNIPRAVAILRDIQHNLNDVHPDTISFNTILSALASGNDPRAAQKVESFLQEMQQLYINGDKFVKPDVITFSSVINLLSKSDDIHAPQRAEQVLRRMQKEYEKGNKSVKPNAYSFSAAINAWSKSGAPKAAHRAEMLLRWMQELHNAGDEELKPNTVVYASVIAAWSKSRSPKACQNAESLLREMQQKYEDGDNNLKPNTVAFTAVIHAFANSRQVYAAEKAEAILFEMQSLYEKGNTDVKPNTVSYNSVISAHAKSRDPNAGKHALLHLEHMKKLQEKGNEDCGPSVVTYNTVISALTASKSEDAIVKAYDLLREAHEFADAGNRNVQPNTRTYSTLLKAIALSQLPDKARRASNLLKEMQQRSIQPTIFVLDEVLHCCSFVSDEEGDRLAAFEVAKETLDLIHSARNIESRPTTYVSYFRACRNAQSEDERRNAIKVGLQRCLQDGLEQNQQIIQVLTEIDSKEMS
jgi:pentatricopeptide repeat protein